jgi:hypothetical protein
VTQRGVRTCKPEHILSFFFFFPFLFTSFSSTNCHFGHDRSGFKVKLQVGATPRGLVLHLHFSFFIPRVSHVPPSFHQLPFSTWPSSCSLMGSSFAIFGYLVASPPFFAALSLRTTCLRRLALPHSELFDFSSLSLSLLRRSRASHEEKQGFTRLQILNPVHGWWT